MNRRSATRTKVLNFLLFFLFLFGLISLTLDVGFLILFRATWGISSWQPVWPIPLIIALIFIIGAVIHAFLQTVKILNKNISLFSLGGMKHKFFHSLVLAISVVAILFTCYVGWSLTHEQPPDFFPFDDQEATYTITKRNGTYSLIYDSKGDKNSVYVCDQTSGSTNCRTEVNRHIEVMIGNSPIELESLVDESVRITGDFGYSNKQCIAEKCIETGNWAVLNIHTIEEIKE